METAHSADELFSEMDVLHARLSEAQRSLFALISEVGRHEYWADTGARDMRSSRGLATSLRMHDRTPFPREGRPTRV